MRQWFTVSCHLYNKHKVHVPNQRISGPVNAHLTPGPDIYFNAFIAPGWGQTTPWGRHCRFKNKNALQSDFIYIFFMFHHMYIAPGRGRQSTGDKILMTTERPFLFAHMLQVSKWSLRNLILYIFLMILYFRSPIPLIGQWFWRRSLKMVDGQGTDGWRTMAIL